MSGDAQIVNLGIQGLMAKLIKGLIPVTMFKLMDSKKKREETRKDKARCLVSQDIGDGHALAGAIYEGWLGAY